MPSGAQSFTIPDDAAAGLLGYEAEVARTEFRGRAEEVQEA
jgi:hypothetical protein